MEESKKSKKGVVIVVIIILLVLGAGGITAYIVFGQADNKNTAEVKKVETRQECPIDFASYKAVNPEVYAYVEVPGTDIAYPVLQSETDDSYYVNHTLERAEGLPGAIYTEGMNSKDFHDANTILYGHNMRDTSMFGQLHRFEEQEFFDSNDKFYIYTPEHRYTYKIFAAACTSDNHPLYQYDFTTDKGTGVLDYSNYLKSINDSYSHYKQDVVISNDAKLCTLLTCMPDPMTDKRYVVVGYLSEVTDYAVK